jgi:hypothetical protein
MPKARLNIKVRKIRGNQPARLFLVSDRQNIYPNLYNIDNKGVKLTSRVE